MYSKYFEDENGEQTTKDFSCFDKPYQPYASEKELVRSCSKVPGSNTSCHTCQYFS